MSDVDDNHGSCGTFWLWPHGLLIPVHGEIFAVKNFHRWQYPTKIKNAKILQRRIIGSTNIYCARMCRDHFCCEGAKEKLAMALLRYIRPIGGLPDPRGSLSTISASFFTATA